jgi:hypothetical protein
MAGSPRLAAQRAAMPTAVFVGALLLAACGSTAPTTTPTHRVPVRQASNTLCASPGAVVGLLISERSLRNGVQEQAGQPPGPVSVPSVAEARTIARALCGLPPIPGAQRRCHSPVLVTILLLTFRTKLGVLPVVTIEASGCPRVTGAGPVRWAKATPALAEGLHAIVHHEPPVIFAN